MLLPLLPATPSSRLDWSLTYHYPSNLIIGLYNANICVWFVYFLDSGCNLPPFTRPGMFPYVPVSVRVTT